MDNEKIEITEGITPLDEAWLDSDEYRAARGLWIKSREMTDTPFGQSKYYRDARLAYKNSLQSEPI